MDKLQELTQKLYDEGLAKGKQEGIRVYQFLREPLEFRYGKEFWEMLDAAARHILD